MAGPTLDDITESTCPNGTYHKCLPYGDCYDAQSYCSDKSRSVNSCFPDNIVGNNKNLLVWCIEQITNNITRIPNPSCKFACVDKFGIVALYQSPPCQNVTQPTVDNVTISTGQVYNPHDYQENSTYYVWAISVLAICLAASVIVTIVLFQRCNALRRQNAASADAQTQGCCFCGMREDGDNQISRNNSQDSVKDDTVGHADPPASGALETDLNRNLRNASSNIQVESVKDSNTANTQNGAPMDQLDPDQVRSTNTQNGAPMDQLDLAQVRSTNTQNGAPMDQLDLAQGITTNTQREAPMIPTHNDQSTINFQGGHAIYCPQATDSVAPFSSAHFGRDCDDTSVESSALIQRNQATESGDDTSPMRTSMDLPVYIHSSTTILEAEDDFLDLE